MFWAFPLSPWGQDTFAGVFGHWTQNYRSSIPAASKQNRILNKVWGCLLLWGTSNLGVIKVFVLKAVIFKISADTGGCRDSFCHLLCILEYPCLTLSEIKLISGKGSACSRFVCLSPNRKFSTHVNYNSAPSTPLKILFSSVSFCLCPTSPLPPLHS